VPSYKNKCTTNERISQVEAENRAAQPKRGTHYRGAPEFIRAPVPELVEGEGGGFLKGFR